MPYRKCFNKYKLYEDYAIIFIAYKNAVYNCFVDLDTLERLIKLDINWTLHTSERDNKFYAHGCLTNNKVSRKIYMHRWLLNLSPKDKKFVDHEDHNGLNNRRSNLKVTSNAMNMLNRPRRQTNNRSGYLGVCWNKRSRRWRARIVVNGKEIQLGEYIFIDVAAKVVEDYRKEVLRLDATKTK